MKAGEKGLKQAGRERVAEASAMAYLVVKTQFRNRAAEGGDQPVHAVFAAHTMPAPTSVQKFCFRTVLT